MTRRIVLEAQLDAWVERLKPFRDKRILDITEAVKRATADPVDMDRPIMEVLLEEQDARTIRWMLKEFGRATSPPPRTGVRPTQRRSDA